MRSPWKKLCEDATSSYMTRIRIFLEDVLIEIKQAIEMSSIYLNILSGTMDSFRIGDF